jgi:acyl dehydratase
MPGPYDNGPQRIGMMASAVTNWMGDNAVLTELSVRLKRPVIFGDVSRFGGSVSAVAPDAAGGGDVDLDLTALNQLGEVTATGSAKVRVLAD